MSGALRESLARQVAEAERVPRIEAREVVEAATDLLEWRYDFPPPPWRVVQLARLMVQYERTKPSLPLLGWRA
jgi:hypothetical protein